MFTRQQFPNVFQQPEFSIGRAALARRNFLEWMKAIHKINGSAFSHRTRAFLWRGPFAALYPHSDEKYSWDDIQAYLYKHWDEIGDGGMATLLNALLHETQAGASYNGAITLLNLDYGTAEPWMPIVFSERQKEQRDWPEGWLRPWQVKTP